MITHVTEEGLLIPKSLLEGMDTVEIRRERGAVTIVPVAAEDPISQFGKNPVTLPGINDASERHDEYLYTP